MVDRSKVDSPRKVLTDQTTGILIGASLVRAAPFREVWCDTNGSSQIATLQTDNSYVESGATGVLESAPPTRHCGQSRILPGTLRMARVSTCFRFRKSRSKRSRYEEVLSVGAISPSRGHAAIASQRAADRAAAPSERRRDSLSTGGPGVRFRNSGFRSRSSSVR